MSTPRLLVHLRPEPGAEAAVRSSSSVYVDLRGTIEVLAEDGLLSIGPFESAIFLLPDLAAIANGVASLRDGAPRVEIPLLESAPLWLVRSRRSGGEVEIRHLGSALRHLHVEDVVEGFGLAALELFRWLSEVRQDRPIDAGTRTVAEVIGSVWRDLTPVRSWHCHDRS